MADVPVLTRRSLRRAYRLMYAHYGHQHWWPGETPFEVCVGAILTQNTAWSNVERAIGNLKRAGALSPEGLWSLPESQLAALLRPSGYYNIKTRRLRAFIQVLMQQSATKLERLFAGPTEGVRQRLLAISGVGPETADSMLLYAGGHARFVIDAYTRRIFRRHGWCRAEVTYAELQQLCEAALGQHSGARRLDYWQDYHAQLVNIGKDFCRARNPRCPQCPLRPLLPASGPRG
jgi:endonuclease-3 related protein